MPWGPASAPAWRVAPRPRPLERHQQDKLIPATVELKNRYPDFLLQAVDWSMTMDPTHRPQDAAEFLSVLTRDVGNLPHSRLPDSAPAVRLKEPDGVLVAAEPPR